MLDLLMAWLAWVQLNSVFLFSPSQAMSECRVFERIQHFLRYWWAATKKYHFVPQAFHGWSFGKHFSIWFFHVRPCRSRLVIWNIESWWKVCIEDQADCSFPAIMFFQNRTSHSFQRICQNEYLFSFCAIWDFVPTVLYYVPSFTVSTSEVI